MSSIHVILCGPVISLLFLVSAYTAHQSGVVMLRCHLGPSIKSRFQDVDTHERSGILRYLPLDGVRLRKH